MYEIEHQMKSSSRVGSCMSNAFQVNIGLKQGSGLSPLLFILVMELISRKISTTDALRKSMYADDLVIVPEHREELQGALEDWNEMFKEHRLNMNLNHGWVPLHTITSITITLKYQLKLHLQHNNAILNYNYTMFILITVQFLRKLHFYLWSFGLIDFSCFPCIACCLVTLPFSLAMLFGTIILQHMISYNVWDKSELDHTKYKYNSCVLFWFRHEFAQMIKCNTYVQHSKRGYNIMLPKK